MFNLDKLIVIKTDVLDFAIRVYLTQEHRGKRHLVEYFSRKLTLVE